VNLGAADGLGDLGGLAVGVGALIACTWNAAKNSARVLHIPHVTHRGAYWGLGRRGAGGGSLGAADGGVGGRRRGGGRGRGVPRRKGLQDGLEAPDDVLERGTRRRLISTAI